MANFSDIKAGIKAIVAADSALNGAGQVFDYEPNLSEVTVDPFALVFPSGNEAEYETTSENMRRYGFVVQVFVVRKASRTEAEAEALMTAIIDRLIQAFDENTTFGVSGVLFSQAAPSTWGYALSDKEYRMAEIRLSTQASVDIS